ncbi:unnamed protein product, partial [Brassica oleracea]
VQVLDRFSFETELCVGARSHSDTSRSLHLGARWKGRSSWERRYGSDTS